MNELLTIPERAKLLVRHKSERDGRVKDRMKAVLLRDDGLSYSEIAKVLFLSDEGVRQQIADYTDKDGKLETKNGGSESFLSGRQSEELDAHLIDTLYLRTCDVVAHVFEKYGILYSIGGMNKWLKQHGY